MQRRLDDPGGETITVTVTVNGIVKYMRSATINREVGPNHIYKTDDGKNLIHNRGLGPNELAKRLL